MAKLQVYKGQQITYDEMDYLQQCRIDENKNFLQDVFTDGVLLGYEGGTFNISTITGLTVNVGFGMAVKDGEIIIIDENKTYNADPDSIIDGLTVYRSSGNIGVPVSSVTNGVTNYVWLKYKDETDTSWFALDKNLNKVRYPWQELGYEVKIDTLVGVDGISGDYLLLGNLIPDGITVKTIDLRDVPIFEEKII